MILGFMAALLAECGRILIRCHLERASRSAYIMAVFYERRDYLVVALSTILL